MKRVAAVAVLLIALAGCGGGAHGAKGKPRCGRHCQQQNDLYFQPNEYTDYFVNDSDGGKDLVFTVYRRIRLGDFVCDVVKSDNGAVSAVCPAAMVGAVPAP